MVQDRQTGQAPAVDDDSWLAGDRRPRYLPAESTGTPEPIVSHHRRHDGTVARHSIDRPDWEPVEGEKRYLATVVWTIIWYAVPIALYCAWSMVFDDDTDGVCAHPVNNVCPPARNMALDALGHSVPWLCVAIVFSLLVALLIRLGSGAWRPVTAAFSAAVIGAGTATILFSVVTS
jgi:hypothetical protein